MWVRGLKQDIKAVRNLDYNVAPHVGAWIETIADMNLKWLPKSRTPCGCVD